MIDDEPKSSKMTLRDYFAAKAMHAIINEDNNMGRARMAKWAYDMADAMLAARDEQ